MEPNTLQEIYDSLPTIECKGLCSEVCKAVSAEGVELEIIKAYCKQNDIPFKEFGEPEDNYFSALICHQQHPIGCECMNCPYLKDKRCTIHPVRPFICRLWGVTEMLKCPHGCKISGDGKLVPHGKAVLLLRKVEAL